MARHRISFVTTAHAAIGTGHLRRCLTLAEVLLEHGIRCRFIVYEGDPSLRDWVQPYADSVVLRRDLTLDEGLAEARNDTLVVIDSYDVHARQLQQLLDAKVHTVVIDDLADRPLPATWLLNSCVTEARRYAGLTDGSLLLGPQYALLRPQFRDLPRHGITGPVRRLLLAFGGSDVMCLTERVLRLLDAAPGPLHIRVAAGRLAGVERYEASRHQVEILQDVFDMAELMTWADLAIASAGQTMFELAAAGCPALCLQVADNQNHNRELFARIGSAVVRDARAVSNEELTTVILDLLDHVGQRAVMSQAGQTAVDGRGAHRVVGVLQAGCFEPWQGACGTGRTH